MWDSKRFATPLSQQRQVSSSRRLPLVTMPGGLERHGASVPKNAGVQLTMPHRKTGGLLTQQPRPNKEGVGDDWTTTCHRRHDVVGCNTELPTALSAEGKALDVWQQRARCCYKIQAPTRACNRLPCARPSWIKLKFCKERHLPVKKSRVELLTYSGCHFRGAEVQWLLTGLTLLWCLHQSSKLCKDLALTATGAVL